MALQDSLDQLKDFDINDLDVNNIGAWPAAIKFILLLIIFLLVVVGGYFFYVTDKIKKLDIAKQQESALRTDYEGKAFLAANLEEYRKQKEEMKASFGALLRQLPSDTEVPGLLEDITLTALNNGLKIGSIDLEPERRAEFYVELPIKITVEGGYHDLGAFVSGVANLSRIVTLHDFQIAPINDGTILKMSIIAKTYRYLDDEGAS